MLPKCHEKTNVGLNNQIMMSLYILGHISIVTEATEVNDIIMYHSIIFLNDVLDCGKPTGTFHSINRKGCQCFLEFAIGLYQQKNASLH